MVTRMYQNKFTLIHILDHKANAPIFFNATYGIFLHVQNEGRKFVSSVLLPFPSSPTSLTTMPTSAGTVLLHIYT